MEALLSIATTPGGIVGIALLLGAAAAAVYAPRLAIPAALCACLAGGLGYVERLNADLATATARADRAEARADRAEADGKRLAQAANDNAAAAAQLARDNEAAALAYAADAEQARTDRDEIELARRAAALAADSCRPPEPAVGAEVHGALQGRDAGENDGLSPSMKAALQALKGRRK